jgi:hypothetical protein
LTPYGRLAINGYSPKLGNNMGKGRNASFSHRDVRFPFPSFPRKRESIVDTVKVDPRFRGVGEGWMAAVALRGEGDNLQMTEPRVRIL